jgi:hypothetical protein
MTHETVKARALRPNALLVFCALFSLCVSDNVGPRLLPLPDLSSTRGQAEQRTPADGGTGRARVEMVSAPQNRSGAERQSPQAAPHAPPCKPEAPPTPRRSRRPELDAPAAESSAPFSRPESRGPPRLA